MIELHVAYGSSNSALLPIFSQTVFQRQELGQGLRRGENWLSFCLPEFHSEAAVNVLGFGAGQGPGEFIEAPWWGKSKLGSRRVEPRAWAQLLALEPLPSAPSLVIRCPCCLHGPQTLAVQLGWALVHYFLPSHPLPGTHGGKLGALPTA